MTPEEARALLDGTTPGPWEWREGKDQNGEFVALRGPDGADALRTWDGDMYASGVYGTEADKALAAAAPDMAAMIAGMREEWGVKYSESAHASAHIAWGFRSESSARHYRAIARNTGTETPRIVRRYVTTPEEA